MFDTAVALLTSLKDALYPGNPTYLPEEYPDLQGKVALITGASGGVGLEATKLLVSKNCHVIMGVRNTQKADQIVQELLKEKPDAKVDVVRFDLSDLSTFDAGVADLQTKTDKLNIIIHNAGVMDTPLDAKSTQGYELQLGTNVVGPYLLQKKLDDFFIQCKTDYKRIVWLSSAAHLIAPANGGINWDDINHSVKPGPSQAAYGQSKAANIYLAHMWSEKHIGEVEKQDIVSVACHPGILATPLLGDRPMLRWIMYPPVYGAYTELYCALHPSLTHADNGKYYRPWGREGVARPDILKGKTDGTAAKLWDWLDKETAAY